MNEDSMARLGFAFWLRGFGANNELAAAIAFSRDPDYLKLILRRGDDESA